MRDPAALTLYRAFQDWRVQLDGHLPELEVAILRHIRREMEQALDQIDEELQRRRSSDLP